MAAYVPPGWPTGVHPPGSDDFEATAIAWLLDVVPPDFRLHGVLRRHPAALAAMARHHTQACVEGARAGYRTARTELGELLPPHAIDAVLAAYRAEGRRLANTAKAVVLIEEAIRGDTVLPARSGLCGRCSSGHVAPMGRMQLGVSATRTVDACMCATGPVATGPGCHKGRTFPGGKVRLREKLISV